MNVRLADGNSYRVTPDELKVLYNTMETQQPLSPKEVLDILRLCSFGRTDQDVVRIVKDIWHKLRAGNTIGGEFGVQHYNYLLKFSSDCLDVGHTQAIFDEMVVDGIVPHM